MESANLDEAMIAEMIESMPAFPKSVQQVLEIADDINCNPRDLVRVVEHDPVLTGRLLKVVNSAYFGLSRRISSVKEALAFIGLNTLKNVALTLAAVGALPSETKAGLQMDTFLSNSLAVGGTCRWLASRSGLGVRDTDRAFLAGLLHDFGTVVLALHLPEIFREIREAAQRVDRDPYRLEMRLLGTHNFELGALVAEKWQLEAKISETIRYHRISPEEIERTPLMDCLWASVALVREINGVPLREEEPETFQSNIGTPYLNLIDERDAVEQAIERTQIFRTV